jgi:hypothetical protein
MAAADQQPNQVTSTPRSNRLEVRVQVPIPCARHCDGLLLSGRECHADRATPITNICNGSVSLVRIELNFGRLIRRVLTIDVLFGSPTLIRLDLCVHG